MSKIKSSFLKLHSNYLHLENFAHIFQAISPDLLQVLEDGLKNWDKATGVPSKIIEHNEKNSLRVIPDFNKDMVGIVPGDNGRGASFVVAPNLSHGNTTLFQIMMEPPNVKKTTKIEVSLRYLLKGADSLVDKYSVYLHAFKPSDGGQDYAYYGITKRPPYVRLQEHNQDSQHGSNLLFHKAIRDLYPDCESIHHVIIASGLTQDQAYHTEEYLVDKYSLYPRFSRGLNMIPGGYEGLRQLHKLGILSNKDERLTPDRRDKILLDYFKSISKKGIPNPLIAEKWNDDAFAETVICGAENRLSASQVRKIRYLNALGYEIEAIMEDVEARNILQVKNVILSKTYLRIK